MLFVQCFILLAKGVCQLRLAAYTPQPPPGLYPYTEILCVHPTCELWLRYWFLKPKFNYADFPVTSATTPRQTRDVPFSPNVITPTCPKLPCSGKFRGSRRNGIWS